MSKTIQLPSKPSQRISIFLVENISFFGYMLFFIGTIVAFAAAYTYLTPCGHGIGQSREPVSDVTLLKGIYFSVITISSLGYGDLHPMGISRALVCVEVLMGLGLVGIMIAKITSQRLSYHVSRLFSSDAQKRLDEIAADFENSQSGLEDIMSRLTRAYPNTPGQTPNDDGVEFVSDFRNVIIVFSQDCVATRDYFLSETALDNYFQSAPATAVVRVGNSIDSAFWILGQLIISLSPQARTEILDRHNRQKIADAINSQRQVCRLVDQFATDTDTRAVFDRIKETCDQVSSSYFAVPEELPPDQVLQGTNEPQQTSGPDSEPDPDNLGP